MHVVHVSMIFVRKLENLKYMQKIGTQADQYNIDYNETKCVAVKQKFIDQVQVIDVENNEESHCINHITAIQIQFRIMTFEHEDEREAKEYTPCQQVDDNFYSGIAFGKLHREIFYKDTV